MVMHLPSSAGYAIAPLERTFYSLLLDLAGGEPSSVHFSFCPPSPRFPETLPVGTAVFEYDSRDESQANMDFLCNYVSQHQIDFVLMFDRQPTSPLYRRLRSAGARCLVSYWGAQISSSNSGLRLLAKRAEIALSGSRLDGLIFESRAMARFATHGRGVPGKMIDVVPLGIDVSRFAAVPSSYVQEAFAFGPSRRIVVYAGHMEERKGVRTIIEAAIELLVKRKRSDVRFLLLGNKGSESAEYQAMYEGLGIDDLITFGGYRPDLSLIFPGCFVGVIASSGWDSFPRTSLEFAACGLPLVVSDLGGLPETIDDGVTGFLFPPKNHVALADRLSHLLDHPDVAAKMGKASRLRCEREYSLEAQARRLRNAVGRHLNR
jgi:glycosyltransferase involved in cell wall biosynthesis